MALKKLKPGEQDLIGVTYKCYNHGDGCQETVTATIWPGARPPRKLCHRCKRR